MSYYTNINYCQINIIFSLNSMIDRTKINDDDYISSFIDYNYIRNEINSKMILKIILKIILNFLFFSKISLCI